MLFYSTGHYQIGVHIADVSYFVREQSALDTEAAQRTTSVYLVERVKSRFFTLFLQGESIRFNCTGDSNVTSIIMRSIM